MNSFRFHRAACITYILLIKGGYLFEPVFHLYCIFMKKKHIWSAPYLRYTFSIYGHYLSTHINANDIIIHFEIAKVGRYVLVYAVSVE